MKNNILFLILLTIPFWNYAQNVTDKIHYIEFVDKCDCPASKTAIENIKKKLYANGYIATDEQNDWQGIREVKRDEVVKLSQLKKYHPNIHKFKDFSLYKGSKEDLKSDVIKVVVTFNPPKNGVMSFNHRTFQKRGHQTWQTASNAGNFTLQGEKSYNEQMIRYIVLLSFK